MNQVGTSAHRRGSGMLNQRKSSKKLVVDHESKHLSTGGGFLSHKVAVLGKPRLERSGGLGRVGNQFVKALKGRARGDALTYPGIISAPRWGYCGVLAL